MPHQHEPNAHEPTVHATGSPTLLALQLLEAMTSRHGDWGVSELAKALGLSRGRVHRHLALLTDAGYVSRNETTHRYDIGWRLVLLGRGIAAQSPFVNSAKPVMERLCTEVGNTIVLSQVADTGIVVTETMSGSSTLSVSFPPGTTYGYNSSAQGKAALAFANPAQKQRWGQLPFEERTPKTITDPELLWSQVARARERGWATAPEETFSGMNAIASPIFNHDAVVVGTVGMVAPGQVIPDTPLSAQIRAITGAAREISTSLGCPVERLPAPLTQ